MNRITNAGTLSTCTANCWTLTFGYDQWTNLTSIAGTVPATLSANANNQISVAPFTYDASGNETADATSTYAWNAESQIKTGGGIAYLYDGQGNRVEKSGTKLYWYGPGGEVLDETDTSGSITNTAFSEYVYLNGTRIARRDYQNNVYYYFEDQVNSSRVIAEIPNGSSTATLCYDADFYPYGGEVDFTSTCSQNYKFQGKERDPETANDYFGARYYSSTYGRFLSADWSSTPAPVPYANLTNPQTLNLYAMVGDNPESFADLDGHCGERGSNNNSCGFGPQWQQQSSQAEALVPRASAVKPIAASTNAPDKPAPTGPDGKPTPPPVPVPGAPDLGWKWNRDDGNPRGGNWGPDGWKGPNPPNGSWDPNGHWDINDGHGSPVQHYDPNGKPLTPDQAHPGPGAAQERRSTWDTARSITPGPIVRAGTTAIILYLIVSEGTRLYPPRNLIPIP